MRRFWVSFLVANLIGALFLWLTGRKLPWAEVGLLWERADRGAIAVQSLIFVGIYAVSHVARMVRWGALVRPLGEVSWRELMRASAVGMTAILLLPLRLGELVRPYVLARRTGLSASALLGTAVVERVIDGLVMTGLLFVTLWTYRGEGSTEFAFFVGGISAAVFVVAQAVCALALWRRDWTVGMVRRVGGLFSAKLTDAVAGLLERFIEGFEALGRAGALWEFFGWTVVYWGANAVSMWLLARFGFGLDVGLWDGVTMLALLVIGLMIPAGPAQVGNFQYFVTQALGLFVALDEPAVMAQVVAYSAWLHVLQFVVIVVPGLLVGWFDAESRETVLRATRGDKRAS
jgi:uncharacterized protein (TIRG00374 family)